MTALNGIGVAKRDLVSPTRRVGTEPAGPPRRQGFVGCVLCLVAVGAFGAEIPADHPISRAQDILGESLVQFRDGGFNALVKDLAGRSPTTAEPVIAAGNKMVGECEAEGTFAADLRDAEQNPPDGDTAEGAMTAVTVLFLANCNAAMGELVSALSSTATFSDDQFDAAVIINKNVIRLVDIYREVTVPLIQRRVGRIPAGLENASRQPPRPAPATGSP